MVCGTLVVTPSGGVGSSPPRAIWFIAREVRSHQDLSARRNKKIGEERRGDYPEAGIDLECEGKTLKTENQPPPEGRNASRLPEETTRC